MIGCDIVKISRFKNNLDKLTNRILTPLEKKEYNNADNKLNYIAGRWAAKEALFKLTNSSENFSILNYESGAPYVVNYPNLCVSISHEREFCIAVAINTLNFKESQNDH
jgi:holo-[acyl-carrier protein] synthase